ncbi:hypothetical protein GCK32_005009 [Trichostrongylus colubriformis]|uniref:Uncharacterized protein n=1 Tax=Trichostrongylus colubriformis TaxID=6319 RepID=A0AAN8INH6_TRICO
MWLFYFLGVALVIGYYDGMANAKGIRRRVGRPSRHVTRQTWLGTTQGSVLDDAVSTDVLEWSLGTTQGSFSSDAASTEDLEWMLGTTQGSVPENPVSTGVPKWMETTTLGNLLSDAVTTDVPTDRSEERLFEVHMIWRHTS